MKKNVVLTGGTGFVGKKLVNLLLDTGFSVTVLSRSPQENTDRIAYYQWRVETNSMDEEALLNADYVIHLAGENIADRPWTAARRKAILDSREQSTQLLYHYLLKNNKKLTAFISASGVGIYGAGTDTLICTEDSPVASDFLGTVCQKWEAATLPIALLGIRTAQIRTGLVLGKNEGVLKRLVPLFRFRLGSALGSGKQYMPWIHVDDLCKIYLHALQNSEIKGPYNAAVSSATTNRSFSETLAKVLGYRIWLPNVPGFVLRLFFGQMAQLLLTGRSVSSEKIEKSGFQFEFTHLEKALLACV